MYVAPPTSSWFIHLFEREESFVCLVGLGYCKVNLVFCFDNVSSQQPVCSDNVSSQQPVCSDNVSLQQPVF